jgi:2-haloacid dehalogenase
VAERWATFDCYGTLVDWNRGIGDELARIFGAGARDRLLRRYHELEPIVETEAAGRSYRDVLTVVLERVADAEGVELSPADSDALPRSLPRWPAFPEVPAALEEALARGWKLGMLSNSDPDLIEASIDRIGVPFDLVVVASEIGSYKPDPGHWRTFEERVGRLPDAHVAASLFHDVRPTNELGVPCVWINRLAEKPGSARPPRELTDLSGLADVLDEVVPPLG